MELPANSDLARTVPLSAEEALPAPAGPSRADAARRLRSRKLYFARPDIGREEIAAVTRVLRSGWLTSGPETQAFETEFAARVGAKHAIAVNSCTAAMHLAAAAWKIGAEDAVLIPAMTFTATAEVFEYSGALPIILDVNRDTYLFDVEIARDFVKRHCRWKNRALIHKPSGRRIRALAPVHLGGRPCDMGALRAFAREYGLKLIDDAAHAFPSEYGGKMIGADGLADASAFSFYATKNLTTGEGGMLTLSNDRDAERIRRMRLHGIKGQTYGRKRWHYDVTEPGYKYNLTDMAAAMGRVQLARSADMLATRRSIEARYAEALAELPGLRLNPPSAGGSGHLYTIEISPAAGITRDRFVEEMYARNVAVSLHFIPLYRLTRYRKSYGLKKSDFKNSERIYAQIVSLPIYSAMTRADVDDVIHAVRETLAL